MKLTTVSLNRACPSCGSHEFRLEAERRENCPVVCGRCGHCAGTWGRLRNNGMSATTECTPPQMAPQRLARREPPGFASSALQLLTRATAIACELRLDLTNPGGSEWVNICGGVHEDIGALLSGMIGRSLARRRR